MPLKPIRTLAVLIIALVAAAVTGGGATSGRATPAPFDHITPGPSPAPPPQPILAGSWSVIADAPWGTIFPAAAYTGEELLVVDLPTGRTMTYDPEANPESTDGPSTAVPAAMFGSLRGG